MPLRDSSNKSNPHNPSLFSLYEWYWKPEPTSETVVGFCLLSKKILSCPLRCMQIRQLIQHPGMQVVFVFHNTANHQTLDVCVCWWVALGFLNFFWHFCSWGMLLSFVVLQSKPFLLRGKYVQCSEAQVPRLNFSYLLFCQKSININMWMHIILHFYILLMNID